MALNLKNIGRRIFDALDRDKEQQGFQFTKPNSFIRQGVQRVQQSFKEDPMQYSLTRGFSNIVPNTQAVLSPINTLNKKAPNQFARDVSYGLRGATQLTPFQAPNSLGFDKRGQQNYISSRPITDRDKQAQSIGRTAYGYALTAPIGGANYLRNTFTKAITGAGAGAAFGSAISPVVNAYQAHKEGAPITSDFLKRSAIEGAKSGAIQGIKSGPLLSVTNPLTSKVVGALGNGGGVALNQITKRSVGGVANLIEDEILNSMDGVKSDAKGKILSIALGAAMTGNDDLLRRQLTSQSISPKQANQIVESVDRVRKQQIRDNLGRFTRNNSPSVSPRVEMVATALSQSGRDITKLTPQKRKQVLDALFEITGNRNSVNEFLKSMSNETKKFIPTDGGFKVSTEPKANSRLALQSASGVVAGFEPEYDEDGKLVGMKFNPTNAALGIGAMAGIQKVKDLNLDNFKINDELKPTGTKIKGLKDVDINSDGFKSLDQLLNDPNRLLKMGYSRSQVDKISVAEARRIIQENIPPFEHPSMGTRIKVPENYDQRRTEIIGLTGRDSGNIKPKSSQIFISPDDSKRIAGEAYLGEMEGMNDFKNSVKKWIGSRDVANTTATEKALKFANIPMEDTWDVVRGLEGTATPTKPNTRQAVEQIRAEYDSLLEDARASGVDINYLQNYITHIWKEPIEDVQKAMSARGKFKYNKKRSILTYEEGMKLINPRTGKPFTPKYKHPAQILEAYVANLEKAKANVAFMNDLKSQGLLVPASVARNNPDFKPVKAAGIGDNVTQMADGKTYVGSWYAPSTVADTINKVFSEPAQDILSKGLDKTAKLSSKVQDITLSGGAPLTPINAFTFANMQKELLAGRVVSPLKAFFRSFSPESSSKFFNENVGTIKKLQANNIPINSSFNIEDIVDKSISKRFGWSGLMNDPTFKRFLPQLQIQFFNDIESQALRSGKNPVQAEEIAASALKKFYGTITTDKRALRSKNAQNFAGTLFFAPQFRESMVNFWVNNAKAISPVHAEFGGSGAKKVFPTKLSLNNPLSLENRNNTKFLLGSAITYGLMNTLNTAINGHPMSENPEGKQDKLLIPLGDGNTIGLPFLSSIATVPRGIARQANYLANGDPQGAFKDAMSTYTSSLLKAPAEVAANQDYFGNQIYDPMDKTGEKIAAQSAHIAKSYMHPYAREGLNVVTQSLPISDETKKSLGIKLEPNPAYQTISQGMELPVRFYKTNSVKNAPFWDSYFKNKAVADKYDEMKYKEPQKALKYLQDNRAALEEFNKQKVYAAQYGAQDKDSGIIQDYLNKNGQSSNKVYASSGGGTKIVKTDKNTRDFIKERIKLGDSVTNDELVSAYLGDLDALSTTSKYEKNIKTGKVFSKISDVENNEYLSEEQKNTIFDGIAKQAGLNRDDLDYYMVARHDTNVKMGAIYDQLDSLGNDKKGILEMLAGGRKEVNGARLVNDAVLDNLYDDGVITKEEKKYLESLKWDPKTGKVSVKAGSIKPKTYKVTTKAESTKINWKPIQKNRQIINLSRPSESQGGLADFRANIKV